MNSIESKEICECIICGNYVHVHDESCQVCEDTSHYYCFKYFKHPITGKSDKVQIIATDAVIFEIKDYGYVASCTFHENFVINMLTEIDRNTVPIVFEASIYDDYSESCYKIVANIPEKLFEKVDSLHLKKIVFVIV